LVEPPSGQPWDGMKEEGVPLYPDIPCHHAVITRIREKMTGAELATVEA
jgi:hypothetical protein